MGACCCKSTVAGSPSHTEPLNNHGGSFDASPPPKIRDTSKIHVQSLTEGAPQFATGPLSPAASVMSEYFDARDEFSDGGAISPRWGDEAGAQQRSISWGDEHRSTSGPQGEDGGADDEIVQPESPSGRTGIGCFGGLGDRDQATAKESWTEADPTSFMVRGLDYAKSKKKEPCAGAFYRLVAVDVYSFDFKLHHIARHVSLPEPPQLGPGAAALPADQQLPPLLIINVQLPSYAASLFGHTGDGTGASLVYYFALPEGWEPSQEPNKAALALLQRFIHDGREADKTPTRDRLKLIPRVVNVDQWAKEGSLSSPETRLLHSYNDKPLLTRPQQRFHTGPNYFEVDLDIHSYAYFARKAFGAYYPRLEPVVFENGFVVQGNRPEELPEVLIGAARVIRVDFLQPRPFPAKLTTSEAPSSPRRLSIPKHPSTQI